MNTEAKSALASTLSRLKSQSASDNDVARYEEYQRKKELLARGLDYESLVKKSGIPARYVPEHQSLTGEGWNGQFRRIAGHLGKGVMIAFSGGRGTGKTQMATHLLHHAARKGTTIRYTTAMQFYLQLRATFQKESNMTELKVVEDFSRPGLLVIDECQERGESSWHDRMLTLLLDQRYANLKDTILITNQIAEKFAQSIGDSNASRISEVGMIIRFDWPTYRIPML